MGKLQYTPDGQPESTEGFLDDESPSPYEVQILEVDERKRVSVIRIHGKQKKVAVRSLFVLPLDGCLRRRVLRIVESRWCDNFILLCIALNSLLLALEKHRAPATDETNIMVEVISQVLSGIFLAECVLKIIGWGFRVYIRDPWNILDFVVVVSAVIEWIPFIPFGGLGFLRLFRVLRPLRSLNSVPEMKLLVNTTVGAIPRLVNVAALGLFIFLVFAIVGTTLMPGIFYRECHLAQAPTLVALEGTWCWQWPKVGDGRLCGGHYDCRVLEGSSWVRVGYCGGHEFDEGGFAPVFKSNLTNLGPMSGGPYTWCSDDDKPLKVAPELDFVHFDHLGGAFLLIFQCMTMEGWTDIMYYVKDAFSYWFAVVYFCMLIVIASHFLLNVALAVVDEVRDDFDGDEEEQEEEEGIVEYESEELWSDCALVVLCRQLTEKPAWQNFILMIITANVITMCLQQFPPNVLLEENLQIIGYTFLAVFVLEMTVELISRGFCGYIKNPSTAFDGFVVIISLVETLMQLVSGGGGGSALQALRTLRLFRVLNKFASRNPKIAVLVKAMVGTAKALRYWLVLFILVLYICTLMWMHFFANALQFEDADSPTGWSSRYDKDGVLEPWCELDTDTPLARQRTSWHYQQDCIPRAHYDNFGWGFVTVFQIMTGENWNVIMYGGMRATRDNNWEWAFGILYILLLLFGQTLFLSLFLSMLLAKFDEFRAHLSAQVSMKKSRTNVSVTQSLRELDERLEYENDEDEDLDGENEGGTPRLPGQTGDGQDDRARTSRSGSRLSKGSSDREESKPTVDEATEKARRIRKKRQAQKRRNEWPYGWSWFIFPEKFPVRIGAQKVLDFTVVLYDTQIKLFDTFILICIILSTLGMMMDYPLADPNSIIIQTVRSLDVVFAIIFIVEMGVKLLAWPLFWGENAYLWSPGCAWNWLDFVVVMVSIMGFSGGGPSELKTLRILRAFRPLRVVKRLETLKNIVSAIFNSMKELGVLLVVFCLFLLIFALVFMMYLSGTLYACSENNVWFHRDVGDVELAHFTLPLCLWNETDESLPLLSVQVRGEFNETSGMWSPTATGSCGRGVHENYTVTWQRATPDTPICVARCDPFWSQPFNSTYAAPASLCPRKYETIEELPHRCGEDDANNIERILAREKYAEAEAIGFEYIDKMQRHYVIPCAGSTEASVSMGDSAPGAVNSCRTRFCPVVDPELVDRCKRESEIHPHFCFEACQEGESAKCRSCRLEYRAACECPDFCTPLIKDAALCTEQGGAWEQVLSHNFDNIWNSMLLLIQISTTEGWVDAMYAASDTNWVPYVQPLRDASHPVWMILFVVWILFSFMFLMNLGVGIIVDKFMEMRAEGKDIISPSQLRWIKSRLSLQKRGRIFSLTNLHLLSRRRRKIYNLVENPIFERSIMVCIVVNTLLMALVVFPELEGTNMRWWADAKDIANYFFAFIFTVEAVLKLIAFKRSYWKDSWNCFDFVCVVATMGGIALKVFNTGINLATVASVVRIFRIARLFRLLKIKALRNLNKLFKSLAISVIKLANVGVVAFLFLVLFSILGVSLFGTVSQESDTHNEHANFQNFIDAFITLFRASTGEAWNEIMHDLHKDEGDWFRSGSWCTPGAMFDTDDYYHVLKDKCLIEQPNACVLTLFGDWNPLPWLYWVSYTWFIGLVIMNVVIAVILEGYEETKSSDEAAMIDTCKHLWGTKYDPDHRMSISFPEAIRFIVNAINVLQDEGVIGGEPVDIVVPECGASPSGFGVDLSRFPLRFARALDVKPTEKMAFHVATRQVLRFATILESVVESEVDVIQQLDQCDQKDDRKDIQRLRALEAKDAALQVEGEPLGLHIAAIMVQRIVRAAIGRLRRRKRNRVAVRDEQGNEIVATAEGHDEYLRRAAAAEKLAGPTGLTPPAAG